MGTKVKADQNDMSRRQEGPGVDSDGGGSVVPKRTKRTSCVYEHSASSLGLRRHEPEGIEG